MDSKHLVDRELAPALALSPSFQFSDELLPQVRAMLKSRVLEKLSAAPASDVIAEERFIPGPEGAPPVRILIFSPKRSDGLTAGYLHLHGGGYIMGLADMANPNSQAIVAQMGCTVISVDYRLAPETPHPGPVEDCYAALAWFHENAAALGVDPARIAIGGDSAGGGLAAALGLLARDRAMPVCFQVLGYPMLDDRTGAVGEPHPYAGEFVWTAGDNRYGWQALLGRAPGGADVSPYAAASRAEDLTGLPPTFIGVGSLDLFLEENIEYARKLMQAGVPTELHVYPGAFHGSDLAVEDAVVSKQYRRDRFNALQRGLEPR